MSFIESNERFVAPARRPGDYKPEHPELLLMRRQQIVDRCRAYGIKCNPDAPKDSVMRALDMAMSDGRLNGPPINPYYLKRSEYTADEIRFAKTNGGWFIRKGEGGFEQRLRCEVLGKWIGPDPEGDRRPKEYEPGEKFKERQKNNASQNVINKLRAECKRLSINSFGKGRTELARLIAERQGMLPPEEQQKDGE